MHERWFKVKSSFRKRIYNHLIVYPTPSNISYYWGFGSLAGLILIVQLRTGVFLAIHYTPHVLLAFSSVEHIIRDVSYGWLIRYIHSNGASFFFIVIYRHIIRGLYYGSYIKPRELLWLSGVVLFLIIIGTGFIGYVLPFGQMSLWGATVITNLASAIPFVGKNLVEWLWGGFAVDNATLNRFFSLHYILPFVIVGRSLLHLILLHANGVGSSNPIGVDSNVERTSFYPYFYVKDLLGFRIRILSYSIMVFFYPNMLGHSDNYIIANSIVTPTHIVPEWYFLIFYAILRSIPHKFRGVVCILSAIRVRMLRPYRHTSEVRISRFRFRYIQFYWLFISTCLVLTWIGQQVVEYPYIQIGQLGSIYYFTFLRVIVPLVGRIETILIEIKLHKN